MPLSTVLHHEVDGEGDPLVFIHGLGATSNVWHAQRAVLSQQFKVIVYDRSGCGLSSRPDAPFSIEGWATELAALLDELGVGTTVVVGHSLGSMIAQHFASVYPDRTRALVLAGGEAVLMPTGKDALAARADLIEAGGLTSVVDSWLSQVLSAATYAGNPALAGLLRAMFLSNDPQSYAQQARTLRDGDVTSDDARISCPTLLLVGDQDRVTPLHWQQSIASAIPGSHVRVIPDTGHMTMLESPAAFNVALLEFLAGLDESRTE